MDFKGIMPRGVSQSPRANPVVFHFSEVSRGVKSLETESGGQGLGLGWSTEFPLGKMKRSGEGGDSCIMHLMPLECTLKRGLEVSFLLCIFYHNNS